MSESLNVAGKPDIWGLRGRIEHKYVPSLNMATTTVLMLAIASVVLLVPHIAFAIDAPSSVTSIIDLVGKALQAFGAGLAIWGIVKIGTSFANGSGASGNELSEGIGRIAGGVLIFAAATAFDSILD